MKRWEGCKVQSPVPLFNLMLFFCFPSYEFKLKIREFSFCCRPAAAQEEEGSKGLNNKIVAIRSSTPDRAKKKLKQLKLKIQVDENERKKSKSKRKSKKSEDCSYYLVIFPLIIIYFCKKLIKMNFRGEEENLFILMLASDEPFPVKNKRCSFKCSFNS